MMPEHTVPSDGPLHYQPTHELYIGGIEKPMIRILPNGHVVLAEGLALDAASVEFWRAIETLAPGTCQRILDEWRTKP